MKRGIISATLLVIALSIPTAHAEEKTEEQKVKKQTNCPVMTDNPINEKLFVDVEGKRIYVCCNTCLKIAKEDPAKYIKQLEAKGITVEKVIKKQTLCPVMKDNPISKDLYVDAEGKRIYVCCNACVKMVKENPKKYIKELENQGITLLESPKKSEK
jgi:YHS domain-containing protein